MLKNLVIYTIAGDIPAASNLAEHLAPGAFVPCGPTGQASAGWVPPREIAHAALVEFIAGHLIVRLMVETKLLPAEVVTRRVDELAAIVYDETGRKPGKAHRRELKDRAMAELLPQAFARRTAITGWIDPVARLLVVGASSATKGDLLLVALARAVPNLNLHPLRVKQAADAAMAVWMLHDQPPLDFTIDRDAVLVSTDDAHSVVRYQQIPLDAPDVHRHLQGGKQPSRLAMTYNARVSFVLCDDLRLQRVVIGDGAILDAERDGRHDDEFDANVAITTGELRPMLRGLLDALGGVDELPVEAAASGADSDDDDDQLYQDACDVVRKSGKASISLVQRHLRIGYNRAARLLEAMEKDGLVSPQDRTGSREVLASDDMFKSRDEVNA